MGVICVANTTSPVVRQLSYRLSAINTQTEAGQKVHTPRQNGSLQNLGKADTAAVLTVADTDDLAKIFPADQLNGDGIITVELAASDDVKLLISTLLVA